MTDDFEIENLPVKDENFKSGFVTILGKPNVGKSTLMNALIGTKIAIVTPKAQTTRDLILGILTGENFQIVFQDIPGVIQPKDKFNERLMNAVDEAVESQDIIYHIVDIHDKFPMTQEIEDILNKSDSPKFLIINKLDLIKADFDYERYYRETSLNKKMYDEVFTVSALKETNLSELIEKTVSYLKHGQLYYDPEQICNRDMRFISGEIVREKIFELLGEEVPYSVAVKIEEFKEKEKGKFLIRAYIYVERDSQKGIIIGKGGEMLKNIGTLARKDIEKLLDHPVYLELWVKVRKNWKKSDFDLNNFGYK